MTKTCSLCSRPIQLTSNREVPSVAYYSKRGKEKRYLGHYWPTHRPGNLCYYHQLLKDLKQ